MYDRDETGTVRCPGCQAQAGQRERYDRTGQRPVRAQRSYGAAYEKARDQLLATATSCYWCGAPFTEANQPTAYRLVPVSHGGTEADLVATCAMCNSARTGRTD